MKHRFGLALGVLAVAIGAALHRLRSSDDSARSGSAALEARGGGDDRFAERSDGPSELASDDRSAVDAPRDATRAGRSIVFTTTTVGLPEVTAETAARAKRELGL